MPIIPGDGGPNTLTGGSADDTLLGLGGDDTLLGNGGRDSLDGGAGFDTADFAGVAGDLDVDLAAGVERGVTNGALASVEAVRGAADDDAIAGDAGANLLDGRGGDDSLAGRGGDDTLSGGEGNNILDGGAGRDAASYAWTTGTVFASLADGAARVDDPAGGAAPAAEDALSGIEDLVGGLGADTLLGDAAANALSGAGGDDIASGGGGDDTVAAGDGADTLDGGDGFDTADFSGAAGDLDLDLAAGVERALTNAELAGFEAAVGGGGDDALAGGAAANRLDGRGGDDSLAGRGGDDTLSGGEGGNVLDGGAGFDTADYGWATGAARINLADGTARVDGPAGAPAPVAADSLSGMEGALGGSGADTLIGSGAANALSGAGGDDSVLGGAGSDTIAAGEGKDTLDGGDGFDTADFSGAAGDLDVDLAAGVERALTNGSLSSIEAVTGGGGDDALAGDANGNWLDGGDGDDSLSGRDGSDTLVGGRGGNVIDGGAGQDILRHDWATGAVLVNLADGFAEVEDPAGAGPAARDALSGIEHALGNTGNDTLIGDAGFNFLLGGGGDDDLFGGSGNDTLVAGQGADELFGEGGYDTADFSSATVGLVMDIGAGTEATTGSTVSEVEAVLAGSGADSVRGDGGRNRLEGRAGNDTLLGGEGGDTLLGGAGDDSVSGGGGGDTLRGGAGDDVLEGGAGDDTANYSTGRLSDFTAASIAPDSTGDRIVLIDTRSGGEGADTVTGIEFFVFSDRTVSIAELVGDEPPSPGPRPPATILGTEGDDRLVGTVGNDVIGALGGRDWLDLTGEGRRGSNVTVLGDDDVALAHGGQTDRLYDTEEVRFLDGRVTFDPGDPAAQVLRLYEATLNRLPDQDGLNFWIDVVRGGQPLSTLASGFLASPEFQASFGGASTGNGAFVDQLYLNVLGRAGEAEGRAFWLDSLGRGAGRTDILVAFSESAENKDGTASLVTGGIWDRNEEAAEVARLYDTVFGRAPDAPGLAYWKDLVEGGIIDLLQVAGAFTDSAEFRTQYGNLANRAFAEKLYVNTLDRAAEQAGLDYWTAQLDAGTARSAVVLAFSESTEHVAITAGDVQSENPAQFGIVFV